MSTETAKPRCNRLLSVDRLGTPYEHCWLAEDHAAPCPHPTRGNDVREPGVIVRAQSGR